MPKMDGFEATAEIRALETRNSSGTAAPVPIVAMTGFTGPVELEKCFSSGMTDHLPKPFTKKQLAEKIEKYINGPSQPHA